MPQPNQITPAQLMRLLGTSDAPTLFDVRIAEDMARAPRLIPGSIPRAHDQFNPAPEGLVGRVVVICAKGRKLSEGVAALLRNSGIAAEILEGGAVAWADAGLPMTTISNRPTGSLWVTRHRPKIDRIACPWLIRRFVDPAARFLYVAPAEVQAVADRFDGIPFDIADTFYSHRADRCTFDTMLDHWALRTEALDRLSTVIRAADNDRHDLSPQAAGLLAVSVGLSRQYRDDLQQLEVGMTLYDALYRWARDGHDETHDWPEGRTP
jgi:rhodanese-related sulfurtransferase